MWQQYPMADAFHSGYKFNNIGVDDHVCTQFGEHWPPLHCLWHWKMFTIWMKFVYILLCSSKQITSTRKTSWVRYSKGLSHSCFCCKHDKFWQVETCDLQIFTPKMLWKMVANISCMVVCKPNNLYDIICIWKLIDEPQWTFQISKSEGTFHYGWLCYIIPWAFDKCEPFVLSTL